MKEYTRFGKLVDDYNDSNLESEYLICENCGKSSIDVDYIIDPYNKNINGEEYYMNLCDNCYNRKITNI